MEQFGPNSELRCMLIITGFCATTVYEHSLVWSGLAWILSCIALLCKRSWDYGLSLCFLYLLWFHLATHHAASSDWFPGCIFGILHSHASLMNMHNKGAFNPYILCHGMVADIKSRLHSSTWFIKPRSLHSLFASMLVYGFLLL